MLPELEAIGSIDGCHHGRGFDDHLGPVELFPPRAGPGDSRHGLKPHLTDLPNLQQPRLVLDMLNWSLQRGRACRVVADKLELWHRAARRRLDLNQPGRQAPG